MNNTVTLPCSSLKQLVREIIAVNHAWKVAREIFGENSPLSVSSRDLKTALQVRLLRNYAPDKVFLVVDTEAEGEKLYGLKLREPIDNYLYAEHLPVRVALEVLSADEIRKFTNL